MFAIMCSVISSSIFNFLSNRYGWATSSTHATIGALLGIGIASGSDVTWGYAITTDSTGAVTGQNGFGAVLASFAISPALAGTIGAIVYGMVKYIVMERRGPASFQYALYSIPFWYGFVVAFEGWLISWKSPRACNYAGHTGGFDAKRPIINQPCMPKYNDEQIIALFFGLFGSVALVCAIFIIPFVRRGVWFGWNGLQVYHLPFMILPDATLTKMFPGIDQVPEWWDDRHLKGIDVPETEDWAWTEKDMKLIKSMSTGATAKVFPLNDKIETAIKESGTAEDPESGAPSAPEATVAVVAVASETETPKMNTPIATAFQPILAYKSAWEERLSAYEADMANKDLSNMEKAKRSAVFFAFYGVDRDIADYGLDDATVANIHDVAIKYYGKTESVFRFLQFLTSTLACFAHGANDVGLSVGPIAILYGYWSNNTRWQGSAISSTPVLDWMLAVAAVSLVLGLWFYGYNMMRVLGNRLTYHSPSRGFSMEMGAAITVLVAARNGIPVSTTNCIVGATIGVGIISGGVKNVNWKVALFTLCAWLLTLPSCGLMSGLLYAFGSYTPAFGCARYTLAFTNTTGGALSNENKWAVFNNSRISLTSSTKTASFDVFAPGKNFVAPPGTLSASTGVSTVFYSPGCAYVS
jgi:solute carrier family 20 (sodium-dependent phosphate transporter)